MTSSNVKDFGAVGDRTTNDTAAVQAAMSAAAHNAGEVFFPAGDYLLDGLSIPAVGRRSIGLRGEHEFGTRLFLTDSVASSTTDTLRIRVENLVFRAQPEFANTDALLAIQSCAHSVFRNVTFNGRGIADVGLRLIRVWGSSFDRSDCRRCRRYGALIGEAEHDTTHTVFRACTFGSNGFAGLLARGMQGGGFFGNSFEHNGGVGIVLQNNDGNGLQCVGVSFVSNYLTENHLDTAGDKGWLAEFGAANFGVDFDTFIANPGPHTPSNQGSRVFNLTVSTNRIGSLNNAAYGLIAKIWDGFIFENNVIEEGTSGHSARLDLARKGNARVANNRSFVRTRLRIDFD